MGKEEQHKGDKQRLSIVDFIAFSTLSTYTALTKTPKPKHLYEFFAMLQVTKKTRSDAIRAENTYAPTPVQSRGRPMPYITAP